MASGWPSEVLAALLVASVLPFVPGPLAAAGAASPPGAAAGRPAGAMSRAEVRRQAALLAALGRALFFDARLSASGRQACASCHDPGHAFGPANARAVQLGGGDLPADRACGPYPRSNICRRAGSSPSILRQRGRRRPERRQRADRRPDLGRPGRPRPQPGPDPAALAVRDGEREPGRGGPARAAGGLRPEPGGDLRRPDPRGPGAVFDAIVKALEVYEQDWRTFYPYSSKYDAYLAGLATLTPAERAASSCSTSPEKGNCAGCHISERGNDGTPPQFTDYGLIALGRAAQSRDPGQRRSGLFRSRLMRAAAHRFPGPRRTTAGCSGRRACATSPLRKVFFHNGVFHDLRKAVEFYATRDSDPERWYPRNPDGSVHKFDDLPPQYQENLSDEPPFDGRQPGDPPALTRGRDRRSGRLPRDPDRRLVRPRRRHQRSAQPAMSAGLDGGRSRRPIVKRRGGDYMSSQIG